MEHRRIDVHTNSDGHIQVSFTESNTVSAGATVGFGRLLKTRHAQNSMDVVLYKIAGDIWNSLGPGYSESVYHRAFEVALRDYDIPYETERIVPVFYRGQNVGHVRADLIIDHKFVIELKSVSRLNETYRIQTRKYLDLLGLKYGYLINFPDKLGPLEFENIQVDRPILPPNLDMF